MARARWYVIQVRGGQERKTCVLIQSACENVSDSEGMPILEEVFAPRYMTRRKYQGVWQDVEKDLLPGYVIAVTKKPQVLHATLRGVRALTKLLMMGGEFVPLQDEERAWLDESTRQGERVVPISIAAKEGDAITVTEGPLKGREARITRINRHKCLATLELNVGGKRITARVGLAVLAGEQGGQSKNQPVAGRQKNQPH